MLKINAVAVGEKGVLKGGVRTAVAEKDTNELREILNGSEFEYNQDTNTFVKSRVDNNGNNVYTRLTLVVSTQMSVAKSTRVSKDTEKIIIE